MSSAGFRDCPLAVVGMGCRLPGASDLASFWELLARGSCALGEVPPERLDQALYFTAEKGVLGKTYSRIGGYVPDATINRDLCPVSERVLETADPVHLTMLQVAAETIAEGRIDPASLPGTRAGVYIGHARGSATSGEFAYAIYVEDMLRLLDGLPSFGLLPERQRREMADEIVSRVRAGRPQRVAGRWRNHEANRVAGIIAETYGLTGPYLAVDAACASSLVALSQAANAIHRGTIDLAIVGGASHSNWFSLVMFSQAQALSATGSFPFDARADGFISSDGFAAIVIKPLARALSDRNRIFGVIRGMGVSTDGRGKSLWAPRKEGQIAAIRRAYASGIDPAGIEYVEAHGTSTQLGDATELEALASELGPRLPAGKRVPVSSVKANIGHTRETAGVAGLVKTLLCMRHGRVPAARYLGTLNPLIPWDTIPFYVPREDVDWPAPLDGPRLAAVDAFGIGGLNAHVVVDDGTGLGAEYCDGGPGSLSHVSMSRSQAPPGNAVQGRLCLPRRASLAPNRGGASTPVRSQAEPGNEKSGETERVAIIAVGVIAPGGRTLADFKRAVDSGADATSDVPAERWNAAEYFAPGAFQSWRSPLKRGGFIRGFQYDWKRNRVPPKQVEHADPLQFMLLDAVDQALASVGEAARRWPRERLGVVVGTGFGGDFAVALNRALRVPDFLRTLTAVMQKAETPAGTIETVCDEFRRSFLQQVTALEDETGSYTSSTLSSRITKTFDLMGGASTVDAGGASSLAALMCAIDRLLLGENDVMICAAGQRSLDVSTYEWFAAGGLLHADAQTPSPDGRASGEMLTGLIPGEAAVAMVLKRLSDARRDGDRVLGIIRGCGAGSDPEAHRAAFTRAIAQALETAEISPDESRWIEAAALGVPAIDRDESAALREVFAGNGRATRLAIGSVVPQFGYCHGAAGLLSLAKLLHVFESGRAPANFAASTALSGEIGDDRVLAWQKQSEPFATGDGGQPVIAGVTCTTLEPLAYHVVLEHPGAMSVRVVPAAPTARMIRLRAESVDELRKRVEQSAGNGATLFAAPPRDFTERDRARLAIVADSVESLDQRLRLAAGQMQNRASRGALEEQGIYVGEVRDRAPRVAIVFPGQGSQYTGMFRELVARHAPAAEIVARIDAALAACGLPNFEKLAWQTDDLGTDVLATQLAVLIGDYLAFELLLNLGARPDAIAGHSYGEYAALLAAGCWTLETALRATVIRARAIETCADAIGILVSTTAPGAAAEAFCSEAGEGVFVANYNAPDQTVLGGRREAVAAVTRRMEAAGFTAREIPVPRPFHTPLMAGVRGELQSALAGLELRPGRIPLLSSVNNRYTSDPRDVRENLVGQLVRPVRYVELVERLLDDGAEVLIEAGPRQVLTRLNRRIIGDRDVALAAFDSPKRPGLEGLLRVRAALECAGCAFFARQGPAAQLAAPDSAAPVAAAATEIVHFDATTVRREKMRQAGLKSRGDAVVDPAAAAVEDVAFAQPAADEPDELQAQLVNFICEQTGYPPEIVGLDADLEADLGIDSIKKAQLLGELREEYEFPPAKDLTLASFPTLRHILSFLRSCPRRGGVPGVGVPASAGEGLPTLQVPAERVAQREEPGDCRRLKPELQQPELQQQTHNGESPECTTAWRHLNVLRLSGTARELGRAHGERESAALHKIIDGYTEHIDGSERILDEIRYGLAHRREFLDDAALDEVAGMAESSGIPEEALIAYNFGLCYEFVPGCSQFAVSKRKNRSRMLVHAINEDWTLGLILRGKLKRLVQARFPREGIRHVLFGTCGQLGGLNGFNASGLCLTSTLLMDRLRTGRPKPGLVHPVLVRRILERATSADEAIDLCRASARTGAWSVCVSDGRSDLLRYLEYDGDEFRVQNEETDLVASTNHGLLHEQLAQIPEHSLHRFQRLRELVRGNGKPPEYSSEFAREVLADRYDGGRGRAVKHATMNTICRVDTQASIVMCPDIGKVWVAHPQNVDAAPGEQQASEFHELDMRELLGAPVEIDTNGQSAASLPIPNSELRIPNSDLHITSRFVMRAVAAPLSSQAGARNVAGPVAILGTGGLAAELSRQFQAAGEAAAIIENSGGAERTLSLFDALLERSIPQTLVLLAEREAPRDDGRDAPAYAALDSPATLVPFQVAQRWLRAATAHKAQSPLQLVAVTSLGGDFGFQSVPAHPAGGALCGLVKALRREFPQIRAKIVDAPAEEPAKLVAARLLEEITSENADIEASFSRGKRRVVRIVPRTAAAKSPAGQLPSGAWVVTGGARGVTAHVAKELASRFGLSLHLVGSSPAPKLDPRWLAAGEAELNEKRREITRAAREGGKNPAEAWREFERSLEIQRNLAAFEAAGVRAIYHGCDVGDRDALARMLDDIRHHSDGPIRGVLHGAGVESAARFDRKKLPLVQATIASKVDGAVNLFELTRGDPLAHFVAFGSVSGRFGNLGQADYSLASDLLAKVVSQLAARRPDCRGVTFHWPAWAETGMAMRPESRVVLESAGHRFMPVAEGCAHVVAELEAGCPEAEVLITDTLRDFAAGDAMPDAKLRGDLQRLQSVVADAPMIEGIDAFERGRSLIAGLRFDPARDRFLIEHQHLDVPILPVVVSLECIAESVAVLAGSPVAELQNVHVVNGFRFHGEQPAGQNGSGGAPVSASRRKANARVVVERTADAFRCELRGDFFNRDGRITDSDRPYVRATAVLGPQLPVTRPEIPQPPDKWGAMQYPTPERARAAGWVVHGPAFRCLHEVAVRGEECWGRIIAPRHDILAGRRRGSGWALPSAPLDACLQICGALLVRLHGVGELPEKLDRLVIGRRPEEGEQALAYARLIEIVERHTRFNVTLVGANGDLLLAIEGYRGVMPN